LTKGLSASSGKRTLSTSVRTSLIKLEVSIQFSKLIVVLATPTRLDEEIESIHSISLIASSISCVIS
jgi:hypothetical protein